MIGRCPAPHCSSGIELEYETFGNADDPTLLLVCGYTSQLNGWDAGLCAQFVDQGLHVVRYDNRDVGLSSKLAGAAQPAKVLAAILDGDPVPEVPYTLSEMAADGIGLLDHLGVERAHIAGVSMGGMIVQMMAIEHPDRIATLTSIMSSTGNPRSGAPTPDGARSAAGAASGRSGRLHRCGCPGRCLGLEAVCRSRRDAGTRRSRLRPGVLSGGCDPPTRSDLRHGRSDRPPPVARRPDARDPRPRRHADHAVGRRGHRATDRRLEVSAARRHGPRPARPAVARVRGGHRRPHPGR